MSGCAFLQTQSENSLLVFFVQASCNASGYNRNKIRSMTNTRSDKICFKRFEQEWCVCCVMYGERTGWATENVIYFTICTIWNMNKTFFFLRLWCVQRALCMCISLCRPDLPSLLFIYFCLRLSEHPPPSTCPGAYSFFVDFFLVQLHKEMASKWYVKKRQQCTSKRKKWNQQECPNRIKQKKLHSMDIRWKRPLNVIHQQQVKQKNHSENLDRRMCKRCASARTAKREIVNRNEANKMVNGMRFTLKSGHSIRTIDQMKINAN